MRYSTLVTIAMVAVLVGVLSLDRQTEAIEAAQYCQLVKQGKDTGGHLGWPDYKGVYDEQCTPEGKLRPEYR